MYSIPYLLAILCVATPSVLNASPVHSSSVQSSSALRCGAVHGVVKKLHAHSAAPFCSAFLHLSAYTATSTMMMPEKTTWSPITEGTITETADTSTSTAYHTMTTTTCVSSGRKKRSFPMSPRSTTTTRPKTSSPIISKVISVATPIKVSKSTSTHHALTSSKSTSKSTSTHDAPKSSKSTSTTPKQTVKIPSYVNLYKPAQLSTACRCLSMPPRKTVTSTAKVTPTITQVYLVAYTTTMTPYTVKTSTSTSTHHACPTTVR